jgi:hypothetical protein
MMPSGDDYRIKAIDIHAQAQLETNYFNRAELEALAMAYLRLAEQADRNAKTNVVCEPPTMQQHHPPQVEQQQQQSQQQSEAQRQTSLGNDGTK